jgi:hypothetical protein
MPRSPLFGLSAALLLLVISAAPSHAHATIPSTAGNVASADLTFSGYRNVPGGVRSGVDPRAVEVDDSWEWTRVNIEIFPIVMGAYTFQIVDDPCAPCRTRWGQLKTFHR